MAKLEKHLGRKAALRLFPPRQGDMDGTWASIERLRAATGYTPRVSLDEGLAQFVEWFKDYYKTPAGAPART